MRGPSVGQWGAGRLSASRMRCSLDPVGANTAEPFLKTGTWFPTTCQVQGGARLGAGQSLSPTEGSLAASKFGGRPQLGPPSVPSNCGMGNPVEGRTSQGKAPQTSRQPSKRGGGEEAGAQASPGRLPSEARRGALLGGGRSGHWPGAGRSAQEGEDRGAFRAPHGGRRPTPAARPRGALEEACGRSFQPQGCGSLGSGEERAGQTGGLRSQSFRT